MKIIVSGGDGGFAKSIKKASADFNVILLNKEDMNVTIPSQIEKMIIKHKPDYFIHSAALTKPMSLHDEIPEKSININIIGTSNVVLMCMKHNIKLIYISTDYVYKGDKGNYNEEEELLPVNSYAWSKLGGECSVRLYKNSLILRMGMTEFPFKHENAFIDSYKSLIYHEEAAEIILKLLNEKGIINIGGNRTSIYDFVIKDKNVGKIEINNNKYVAKDSSMNITKMKKLI